MTSLMLVWFITTYYSKVQRISESYSQKIFTYNRISPIRRIFEKTSIFCLHLYAAAGRLETNFYFQMRGFCVGLRWFLSMFHLYAGPYCKTTAIKLPWKFLSFRTCIFEIRLSWSSSLLSFNNLNFEIKFCL